MILTREAAEALKGLGFPQESYTQMMYEAYLPAVMLPDQDPDDETTWVWRLHYAIPPQYRDLHVGRTTGHWCTAPDDTTALMWLEEHGIIETWWRDTGLRNEGPWGADLPGRIDPDDDDSDSPMVHADSPSDLTLAIAAAQAGQEGTS